MLTRGKILDVISQKGTVSPGTTTLLDKTRYSNNGAMTDITWTKLPSGLYAATFNGSTSFASVTNVPCLNRTLSISFEAWLYNTQDTNWTICGLGPTNAVDVRNYIFQATNLHFDTAGTDYQATPGTTTADLLDQWHFWAGTINTVDDEIYLYLDAVVDGSNTAAMPAMTETDTFDLQIGRVNNAVGTYRYYLNGMMAGLRIYDYVRTPAQIRGRYQATRNLFGV